MKRGIVLIVALIVIVMAGLAALPFLISESTYKSTITAQVEAQTGRKLTIGGGIHITLFPALGVTLDDVALANAPGFSAQPFMRMDRMAVEIAVMPLLHKQVHVNRFLLKDPVINLEVNAAGKNNWTFAPAETPQKAAQSTPAPKAGHPLAALAALQLNELRLENGTVSYKNAQTGDRQFAEKVNVTLSLSRLDAPLTLKADTIWRKESVALDARLDSPAMLLNQKPAPLSLNVSTKHFTLHFQGQAQGERLQGKTDLTIPSIPALAEWTGSPMAWKGQGPLAFSLSGNLACQGKQCALNQANLALDALKLDGSLGINMAGAVPALKASLAAPLLDLNAFLPPEHQTGLGFISDAYAAEGSTAPIDLSGLKAVDADIALTAGAVRVKAIKLERSLLHAMLRQGTLALDIQEMALYGGKAHGRIGATAAGAVTAQLAGQQLQAAPFLHDATGSDRLSGTLAFDLDVATHGASQQQLISALAGKGQVRFTDGALKGINIAQMVRDAKSVLSQQDNAAQKTDFAELGGTFTIASGIVSNQDLAMKAPLLRLSGQGQIDLPRQALHYRLLPTLVGTIKGQGGKDVSGITVPVLVDGPLSKPTWRPDLQGMAQDALKDPDKAKQTLKDAKATLKELKKNPDGLKGLLKGLGGH